MSHFALWSVPVATALAYVPHFAKVAVLSINSSFDSKDPRNITDQTKSLSPSSTALVTRLTSCHVNQLEMLGVYAAGIAAGTAVGVAPDTMTQISGLYVGARIAYVVAYAAPQVGGGILRSTTFLGALSATLWVWFAAAIKGAPAL